MLKYNQKMMKLSYDAVKYVLENTPQLETETVYKVALKHAVYVVHKTAPHAKYGYVKNYIVDNGEYFDCGAALNAALYR